MAGTKVCLVRGLSPPLADAVNWLCCISFPSFKLSDYNKHTDSILHCCTHTHYTQHTPLTAILHTHYTQHTHIHLILQYCTHMHTHLIQQYCTHTRTHTLHTTHYTHTHIHTLHTHAHAHMHAHTLPLPVCCCCVRVQVGFLDKVASSQPTKQQQGQPKSHKLGATPLISKAPHSAARRRQKVWHASVCVRACMCLRACVFVCVCVCV